MEAPSPIKELATEHGGTIAAWIAAIGTGLLIAFKQRLDARRDLRIDSDGKETHSGLLKLLEVYRIEIDRLQEELAEVRKQLEVEARLRKESDMRSDAALAKVADMERRCSMIPENIKEHLDKKGLHLK